MHRISCSEGYHILGPSSYQARSRRLLPRGVFDQAGWINCGRSPGIGIGKTHGYDLLRDVARVAVNVDIYPLLCDAKQATLRFRERRDWLVFESTIGASLGKDTERLSELCAMRATKKSFEIEQYQSAFRLVCIGRLFRRCR